MRLQTPIATAVVLVVLLTGCLGAVAPSHSGPLFVDVTPQSGIRFAPRGLPGVALADINADGILDILVGGDDVGLGIFLGRGDLTFADVSDPEITDVMGFAATDVDGDGRTDVVLVGHELVAWLDEDEHGFTAVPFPNSVPPRVAASAAFGPLPGSDGVGLYVGGYLGAVASRGSANQLWIASGDASWREQAAPLGVGLTAHTLGVAWTDVDGDGALEILAVQDFAPWTGWRNALLHRGATGVFHDIAPDLGLDHEIFAMGIAVFDADGDGMLDLYVTNLGANVLAMRRGARFEDQARSRGAAVSHIFDPDQDPPTWPSYDVDSTEPRSARMARFLDRYIDSHDYPAATSWSAVAFDYDHDGDEDLFVTNGPVGDAEIPEARVQRDVLLTNRGDGTFVDDSGPSGLDFPGDGRGAAAGDLDGDGDLDLVVADGDYVGVGAVRVYRNDVAAGNYLTVTLRGVQSTPDGLGARVLVHAGGRQQLREISTVAGFASARAATAHFGLADTELVDEVRVEWPSGVVTRLEAVAANQKLTITEGQ
jgi:hypothetical protein